MKKGGFTLIEVMIAITVFSIGVLAVLNLIIHNLSTIDKVQTKITATFLAKEWIELAYNIRDTNLQKSFARDCILKPEINELETDVCETHFASGVEGQIFQLSFDPDKYYLVNSLSSEWTRDEIFDANKLYYYTWNGMFWYANQKDQNWQETDFARYLVFTGVVENWEILPVDKILKVESHVLYRKGWYTWDIFLESFIWNL